jgi:uncharacterized membrane protein
MRRDVERNDGIRLVELKCRNCGSRLSPENISSELSAARCGHCNALFAIEVPDRKPIPRPEVALPKRLKIEERMDGLTITRRWLGPTAFFLLFFAVLWNGFMIFWNGMAIKGGAWMMLAFGGLHTGVGLFLVYLVLGMFLNSTVIRVTRGTLEVKIGPLPWRGNKSIQVHDVTQLYCREKVTHGKNGPSVSYKVETVLSGNKRETLVGSLTSPDEALFIEQQLERHLGLVDVPVAGEFGR